MSQPFRTDNQIQEFLPKALAAGVPQASLVALLTAHGWREKDVYRALGDHLRSTLGVEVPRRPGSGTGAREAFFYLLIFSTLATWTTSLGCLAFQFINHCFPDPLFTGFQQLETYETTWSLAALLVAFPIYLLITRAVLIEAAADPARLEASFDSSIRKWLTYMALVVAASIFMGDLICALAFLLRGEVTSRFLLKALVVLALSGGVFYYYFGGLHTSETANPAPNPEAIPEDSPETSDGAHEAVPRSHTGPNRTMLILSGIAVALMLVLGFTQLGAPRNQRALLADRQRVQNLYLLSSQIEGYYRTHNSQLPPSIGNLPGRHIDPLTLAPYQYQPGSGSQFSICADFTAESQNSESTQETNTASETWHHPAGHHCFSEDATSPLPYPMQ
jgi:hypothetical protein